MTDIVERLRKVEPDAPGERTRWLRNPDGPEAADEIERLREALRDINMLNNANDHGDSPRLHIGGIRMIIRSALEGKE